MTRETLEALKREHMGDGVCLSMSQVGQLLRIAEAAMELTKCNETSDWPALFLKLKAAIGGDDDNR